MRGPRIKTYKPHGIRGASGRRRGSWFQHCCINTHRFFVKVGLVGRGGRLQFVIIDKAARGDLSLNGAAPVKTFV